MRGTSSHFHAPSLALDQSGTCLLGYWSAPCIPLTFIIQRAETDFFHGEPLRALSTLVYSENVDLQRSASLTFAEITERGAYKIATELAMMQ